ncbi:MAG: PKD domain-containing protein [Bacteroidota bacterium]
MNGWSKHIIGGEVTYECLGNGRYDFTMHIYRDCRGGGACFDSDAGCGNPGGGLEGNVTFFRGTSIIGVLRLTQPTVTRLQPNLSNPCLIAPPNVCVEEGIYRFAVDLPETDEPITLSYQRCCRNETILNLSQPGDVGATYTVTLSKLSRDSCNSSPVFKNFPPIVICIGEDVNFDHSATDIDGDSLVYSFCSPFQGGGNDLVNFTRPEGVAPDPETPPPYDPVRFTTGYSFDRPLNLTRDTEVPPVSIDSKTGLISGIPTNQGQYVVGVCVQAYSDGVLVNEVRRDFQFNVAECENSLVTDVEETELRTRGEDPLFFIRICGDDKIINESRNRSLIESVYWEFDIPGGKTTSTKFDPDDLFFPGEGPYDGKLVLNPGFPQCTDSGWVQVEIFPEIVADFEFDYDTCDAGPVEFTNLSFTKAGPEALIELKWELDTVTLLDKDISWQFTEAGTYDVLLTARDSNNCTQEIEKEVEYFPVPPLLAVAPSDERSCVPANIRFENLSSPITDEYDIQWDFGDGNQSTELNPSHSFEEVGVFTVSLNVISPFGCELDTSFNSLIETLPSPVADFEASELEVSRLDPVVDFTDLSIDAIRWDWLFDGFGVSRERNPTYTFRESGSKIVRLITTGENGCQDSSFLEILVRPDIAYKLPNAFTPNGDGVNDTFFGVGNADEATSFQLTIWNRYGERIFQTTDANEGWNGRKNNIGRESPNGVYVVVVRYVDVNGEVTDLQGFVTLVR